MKLVELVESVNIEVGDGFEIELSDIAVIESAVVGFTHDGIIVEVDDVALKLLNAVNCLFEAEYQGRKVTLNKPMQGDVKKSKVYVKNKKGNIIKVNFGDPNMRIKKNIPGRRKSFRARHKCDTAKDKTTARYWSCKAW